MSLVIKPSNINNKLADFVSIRTVPDDGVVIELHEHYLDALKEIQALRLKFAQYAMVRTRTYILKAIILTSLSSAVMLICAATFTDKIATAIIVIAATLINICITYWYTTQLVIANYVNSGKNPQNSNSNIDPMNKQAKINIVAAYRVMSKYRGKNNHTPRLFITARDIHALSSPLETDLATTEIMGLLVGDITDNHYLMESKSFESIYLMLSLFPLQTSANHMVVDEITKVVNYEQSSSAAAQHLLSELPTYAEELTYFAKHIAHN